MSEERPSDALNGFDRSQTLQLYGDSAAAGSPPSATLRRGSYRLDVRYTGTSRITGASAMRTIRVR